MTDRGDTAAATRGQSWLEAFLTEAADSNWSVDYGRWSSHFFLEELWKRTAKEAGGTGIALPSYRDESGRLNSWPDEMRRELARQLTILPWPNNLLDRLKRARRKYEIRLERARHMDEIMEESAPGSHDRAASRNETSQARDELGAWHDPAWSQWAWSYEGKALRLIISNLWDDLGEERFQSEIELLLREAFVGQLVERMKAHSAGREHAWRMHEESQRQTHQRRLKQKEQRQQRHLERLRLKRERERTPEFKERLKQLLAARTGDSATRRSTRT